MVSHLTLLAMTAEHAFASSPRNAPELVQEFHRPTIKRAQGRPGAHRTHGPRATKKHAAEPQVQADHPAFPAQWFYGLYVISPVTIAWLPPSPAGRIPQASRLHRSARTTRFRRPPQCRSSCRHRRVHRIPSRVRDDASAPLVETG